MTLLPRIFSAGGTSEFLALAEREGEMSAGFACRQWIRIVDTELDPLQINYLSPNQLHAASIMVFNEKGPPGERITQKRNYGKHRKSKTITKYRARQGSGRDANVLPS
jgi:hypothetical protein